METIHWIVDKYVDNSNEQSQIVKAAQLLKQNKIVAFPTETVYGLGANAKSDEAVAKIYEAKGRPSDNPLIVHIAEEQQLLDIVEFIPDSAKKLMKAFWPGPLTIIFNKKGNVLSDKVTAGLETVAVRMPNHPIALQLIRQSNLPVAAPSANRSGKPSPTTAKHVLEDLSGRIAGVLDGGETGVGVESTVIDCSLETPMILRPGGISAEEIAKVIGNVEKDSSLLHPIDSKPRSPGMKYTHYAPDAPVYLVDGSPSFIQNLITSKQKEGLRVGVIATEESENLYEADCVIPCGQRSDLSTVAHSLYETLRSFNSKNVNIIYSESFPLHGLGQAIMNRLEKAAGHRWIYEDQK